jgi:large subunit ribosomal protein L25
MLTVNYPEFERITKLSRGENAIFDLLITSHSGEETRKVILKELTTDPIENTYLHADFYEISMDKEITVNIPVRLVNTPVGVTNGGLLQSIRREMTVSCLPDKLIDSFEIDVSELDIGDSIHIRDITLPEGITCAEEGHITIAVVSAPGGGVEEEMPEEGVEEETAASDQELAEDSKEE